MDEIRSAEDMERMVEEYGFLPFFTNEIRGFSIAEHTPPELWFSDTLDGPWEWKGPVARTGTCMYGKLFRGKAGFVSRRWLPDFLNYRRDGYDYDARYEDGLASWKDKKVYDTLQDAGILVSKELKRRCGYGREGGQKGFDTVITRLQMQTYVNIGDFVYAEDKYGRTYGWGIAKYTTPEAQFGADVALEGYRREPEESFLRMAEHLKKVLPQASDRQIERLLRL